MGQVADEDGDALVVATSGTTGAPKAAVLTHAAVAALFTALGAGDDIVLGAPVAGRADSGLEDIVGFLVDLFHHIIDPRQREAA